MLGPTPHLVHGHLVAATDVEPPPVRGEAHADAAAQVVRVPPTRSNTVTVSSLKLTARYRSSGLNSGCSHASCPPAKRATTSRGSAAGSLAESLACLVPGPAGPRPSAPDEDVPTTVDFREQLAGRTGGLARPGPAPLPLEPQVGQSHAGHHLVPHGQGLVQACDRRHARRASRTACPRGCRRGPRGTGRVPPGRTAGWPRFRRRRPGRRRRSRCRAGDGTTGRTAARRPRSPAQAWRPRRTARRLPGSAGTSATPARPGRPAGRGSARPAATGPGRRPARCGRGYRWPGPFPGS